MNYSQIAARLERYPASPLFARLASEYLDAGRVSDARALCDAGLLEYPEYATAHLILAECHAAENRYREAVDSLRRALELNPDSLLFSGLMDEWEELLEAAGGHEEPETPAAESEIRVEETEIDSTVLSEAGPSEAIQARPDPIPPADDWVQVALESAATPPGETVPVTKGEAGSTRSSEVHSEPITPEGLSLRTEKATALPEVSKALPAVLTSLPATAAPPPESVTIPPLQSAAIPSMTSQDEVIAQKFTPSPDDAGEYSDAGRIVSKTLAEIYVTQGAFDEAILTYRLLKRTRPELVPQIDLRIVELEGLSRGR